MTAPDILATALEADEAGLCAIPVNRNGTKAPFPDQSSWSEYQQRRPTTEQLRKWFDNNYPGIGLVCGKVSGGLEMLEFEGAALAEGILDRFEERARKTGLGELVDRIRGAYEESTPNGGVHWFYRCDTVSGNTPLARRPMPTEDNPHALQVLIETRGEGGFAVIAPSSGPTHPTGDAWLRNEGSLRNIVTISPAERAELHRLACSFDRMPAPQPTVEQRPRRDGTERKPGDDFNERKTWDDVLPDWEIVGRHGEETYWRRPGKSHGISAVTNHLGSDTLKVFSTSTPFDTSGTYTKFGAYTVLNYNGDYDAAARELSRQGFGDPLPSREQRRHTEAERFRARIHRGKHVMDIKPPDPIVEDWLFIPGESVLYAPPKAGKSFLALDFALCVATGEPFMLRPTMQGVALYVAAEGVGGLGPRVAAWINYHGGTLDIEDAYFMTTAVNLLDRQSVDGLLDTISDYQPVTVIFDTLARCTVGADENSAKDMGLIVENLDRVRDHSAGHVMVVHHAGKDVTRGMRGSSALLGAVDTVIAIEGDTHSMQVKTVAQKDAAPIGTLYCSLRQEHPSAVITMSSAAEVSVYSAEPVLEALRELLPEDRTASKWQKQAEDNGIAPATFNRAKKALVESGRVLAPDKGKRGALFTPTDEYESEIF